MKDIFESVAARAANGWQRAGTKFDFEVFAMPGGSVMAPALWAYSMVASALKRPSRDTAMQSPVAVPGAQPSGEASPEKQDSAPGLHCDWSGCHCT
jgi:hypothetical protein